MAQNGLLTLASHCIKSVRIRSYSGPDFPAFGLNTERYGVSLSIQSECEKMRTRITPNTITFHAVSFENQVTVHVSLCFPNFLQVGGMFLPVDEKSIRKIYELVGEGVHQVREMERHLIFCLKNELFKDSPLPGMSILHFALNQNISDRNQKSHN